MTDDLPKDVTPKDFPGPEDPDGLTMADVQPKDGFLDFLLSVMTGRKDELDGSFGITLTVGGAVVSGMAIGRKEWIRLYIDSVREAGPGDFAEVLEQFFPRMQSQLEEEWDRRDAQNLFGRKRSFIHLKDARVYNGHVHEVGLWRGALANVDGWSMGSHCNDVA